MTTKRIYAAALALCAGVALHADDLPKMKEGLWSIHTQSVDNPGNKKTEGTRSICRSHAYDEQVQAQAKNRKECSVTGESLRGNQYSISMHCTIAGSTGDSKTTTTFQGDSGVHSESHMTYTPALYGVAESTVTVDQKYVGSCPAGAEPGDIVNADGTVIHRKR